MQSMVCNVILCFVTLLMLQPKSYVTGLLRKRAAARRPTAVRAGSGALPAVGSSAIHLDAGEQQIPASLTGL
jgi:hypothetical protein